MSKPPSNPYREKPLLGDRPKQRLNRREEYERMLALCEHHGISDPEQDPQAMAKLAYCLAKTHVPGFRPTRPGGRRRERTARDLALVWLEFCAIESETGIPREQTILKRMIKDPWLAEIVFDKAPKDMLQALRSAMQQIRKPRVAKQVYSELGMLVSAAMNGLKSDAGARQRLREKMGADSAQWRDFEELLHSAK